MKRYDFQQLGWGVCGAIVLSLVPSLLAMEPPTPEQLRQYKADGTLANRVAQAKAIGNNKTSPFLVARTRYKLQQAARKAAGIQGNDQFSFAPPPYWQGGIPATGTPKVLVLLVDFPDAPHNAADTVADVQNKFFGNGDASQAPYESLRNYYQRSSYNQLTIQGNVLGWYRAANNRSYYENLSPPYPNDNGAGEEALMMEALNYYNTTGSGHDFTQYDNDNNGVIDALYLKWTGPAGDWATFWWAFQWSWQHNPSYRIDGKAVGSYVWSWIYNYDYDGGTIYQPYVDIHETGHLLGLPDLYDYDPSVGPDKGVGGFDMMDANWGDHNCFSKFMLEWLTPTFITANGSTTLALNPSGTSQDCVLIMPSAMYSAGTIFDEFFMVQYRKCNAGNDPPAVSYSSGFSTTDGLTIWHIDSTLDPATGNGDFLYNNSDTSHKLVRLMEADGLEQIEQNYWINTGDFYRPTKTFSDSTTPNSHTYAGGLTSLQIDNLTTPDTTMSARFSILAGSAVTAAGATILTESCTPPNGTIDDQEMVTVNFSLQNIGTANATNVVATLLATGGVTSPSDPQTYGTLTAGGAAVSRPFVFVANGTCGGTITATLQLQDGSTTLSPATFTFQIGGPQQPLVQDFDAVTAPALPSGWTATVTSSGGVAAWATTTAVKDGGLNSVFAPDPSIVSDNRLESPSIPITTATAQLTFRHNYNLEIGFDGGALEIAIGAGRFADILDAGGTFVTGGYATGTLPTIYGNPLGGRRTWTGNSGGFMTTTVNLPAAAAGTSIKLRWRLGSDDAYGAGGWYVDTISVTDGYGCCTSAPHVPDFDADGDVDQEDFGFIQACFTGHNKPQTDPACNAARLDADTDVDNDDIALFEACRTSAGVAAAPNCRN